LEPETGQAAAFYRALGPLESFRLVEQTRDEKMLINRYRAVFRTGSWIHQLTLTPEGKIAELGVEAV
jgi:hypothetical protein